MEDHKRSNIAVSIILLLIIALCSALLLLCAFIVWLSEVIGSLTMSLSFTGVVLALVAILIYRLSVADELRKIREEYQNAMQIFSLIRSYYHCAVRFFSTFF